MGLQAVFFGPLRIIEHEHMYENTWYALSEILMAMTIFKDEFNTRFAFFFGILLVGKLAHGLLKDRLDFMEQTAVLNRIFHLRMIYLLLVLFFLDVGFLRYSIGQISTYGPSMMLIFAFEAGILTVSLISSAAKYGFNIYDSSLAPEEWESKSIAMVYLDIISGTFTMLSSIIDFFRLLLYGTFFGAVTGLYGLPIHIIRDFYLTVKSLATRIQDLRRFLQATQNMEERYMDATEQDLGASDRLCIICREDMQSAKKLDCGHMFHFKCLKSWLERQQSCPTCRSPILARSPHAAPQNSQPNVSTARESPVLRYGHWSGSNSGHPASPFESPQQLEDSDFNEVTRQIEGLRRIQSQISGVIAEFDRFKSENEH
ncbi:E3 ubiquitin-protein ligase synoviolin [Mitosporidium daphniae]